MNEHSDIGRVLRHWFEDGPDSMPDRVVDTVAARISVNRQRRMVHLVGRTAPVNRTLTYIAAAAAVVIAAIAIWQFLPGNPASFGGQPTPTATAPPTPSAAPTPAPSAGAVLPPWYSTSETPSGAGILTAGSHTTRSLRPGFTFRVPEGWVNDTDEASYFFLFPDTPANQAQFARSESLAQVILTGMHPTPWFTCESLENNRGATAAERVAAASANEVLAVSDQVEVAIGGLTGMQFDVRRNPDWTGTCPADSELPAGVDPKDERSRAIFLDVPGRGVFGIIVYSMSSAEIEAFLAKAMPIVESFQFDLGQ